VVTANVDRPSLSANHIGIAVALLTVHALLAMGAIYLVGINGMNASMCGFYQGADQCGNANWALWGMLFVMGGGGVLLLVDVVVSLWRMIKGSKVIGFVTTMCVLQVLLILVGLMLQGLAT
jgi:hypothetical protein